MSPSFNPLIACGINQYSIPGAGIFYPFNYLLCFMNPVLAIENCIVEFTALVPKKNNAVTQNTKAVMGPN